MTGFEGFTKETIQFLHDLDQHNHKEWFDAHKYVYETQVMKLAKLFVEAMGETLKTITPGINAIPSVNKSIRRINRDTRFSKNKRPYKNHLDFQFWEGGDKAEDGSGFWLRIEPNQICVAAGMCGFAPDSLTKFRHAILEDKSGNELVKALQKAEKEGFNIEGEQYKTVPRGFDNDHPRSAWLKYTALTAGKPQPIPHEIYTQKFTGFLLKEYKKLLPIHQWLMENVV